jgi:uncharacterized protein involved in type VI secretion and phage assembly
MAAQRSTNVFDIKVGGMPLADDVAGALLAATVEDEVNLPDTFELVFRDPLREVLKAGRFEIGATLKIDVGSEATMAGTTIFDGEITAIEAEIERDRTLTIVRGYDLSHRLQHGTTTETHLDVTYGDIAGKVASRHGLKQGDGGTSSVVHEAVVQWNATDWEFLSALAAESGHEVVVTDGALDFRQPGDAANAPGEGDLGTDAARQLVFGANLLRLRATVSGAEQVDEVKVRGWDYKAKEPVEGTARATQGARGAAAGQTAADLAGKVGGGTLVKVDLPVTSAEVAQETAESLVEQLGSAATELEGAAYGNPDLRAGVAVSVAGVGSPFDGSYVLTSCRHTYDPTNGYETGFRVSGRQNRTMLGLVHGGPGGQGGTGRHGVSGVVPALVSNLDDPDKLGRMKVTFPWAGENAESPWARVAMPGAGNKRGLVVLPEVGDEVLVAFDHGDARLPFVVGGLYNGKDELPAEVVAGGEVVIRTVVSRNGHTIELHDKDDTITVATGDGKHKLVLDQKNNKVVLETAGDVEVKSDAAVTVTAQQDLKFESNAAIELKAVRGIKVDAGGGNFEAKGVSSKVEGSASVELSSSGTTTVRGSIVSIN